MWPAIRNVRATDFMLFVKLSSWPKSWPVQHRPNISFRCSTANQISIRSQMSHFNCLPICVHIARLANRSQTDAILWLLHVIYTPKMCAHQPINKIGDSTLISVYIYNLSHLAQFERTDSSAAPILLLFRFAVALVVALVVWFVLGTFFIAATALLCSSSSAVSSLWHGGCLVACRSAALVPCSSAHNINIRLWPVVRLMYC